MRIFKIHDVKQHIFHRFSKSWPKKTWSSYHSGTINGRFSVNNPLDLIEEKKTGAWLKTFNYCRNLCSWLTANEVLILQSSQEIWNCLISNFAFWFLSCYINILHGKQILRVQPLWKSTRNWNFSLSFLLFYDPILRNACSFFLPSVAGNFFAWKLGMFLEFALCNQNKNLLFADKEMFWFFLIKFALIDVGHHTEEKMFLKYLRSI